MFIFGLPTLVNHKERTRELGLSEIHGARKGPERLHETSEKYTCFQNIVLLFKRITVIPENYNQQNRSLYSKKLQSTKPLSIFQKITISKIVLYISKNYNQQTSIQGKNHKKEKRKPEKEKRGEERYSIRNRT